MLSCKVYPTIILVVSLIDWTGAQTSTQKPYFNRYEYLCKDNRVSDETLALLKLEDKKCLDNYFTEVMKISGERDDCFKQTDYSKDKVKDQANKYELIKQCSKQYMECQVSHMENMTAIHQDNDFRQSYENARNTLTNCKEMAFKTVFPPLSE